MTGNRFSTEEEWSAAIDAADGVLHFAILNGSVSLGAYATNGQAVTVRRKLASDIVRAVILSDSNVHIYEDIIDFVPGIRQE